MVYYKSLDNFISWILQEWNKLINDSIHIKKYIKKDPLKSNNFFKHILHFT